MLEVGWRDAQSTFRKRRGSWLLGASTEARRRGRDAQERESLHVVPFEDLEAVRHLGARVSTVGSQRGGLCHLPDEVVRKVGRGPVQELVLDVEVLLHLLLQPSVALEVVRPVGVLLDDARLRQRIGRDSRLIWSLPRQIACCPCRRDATSGRPRGFGTASS